MRAPISRSCLLSPIARIALSVVLTGAAVAYADVAVYTPIARQEQMLFVDDPKVWAQPRRVLAPTYPPALLEKGVTGFVDVEVKIAGSGHVQEILSMKSTPTEPRFETAVRDVLDFWLFHGTITQQCTPLESTGNVRVWFETKNNEPSISISNRASSQASPGQAPRSAPRMTNFSEVVDGMIYPREARRSNVQARVYAILVVDGDTGKTQDVKIAFNTAPRDHAAAFNRTVTERFLRAQFAVGEEYKGTTHNVCKPVTFTLR